MKDLVLIAGGTGFVGKHLIESIEVNHRLRILTRKRSLVDNFRYFFWNPEINEIDEKALEGVTIIINLCGAGIADKRWTKIRKIELEQSRTKPAELLFSKIHLLPNLKQYISASGVNCYPIGKTNIYSEDADFGEDFLSQLVKKWEQAADLFQDSCKVVKLRIGFVICLGEGGLKKMETPIKLGLGSILGSGKQSLPWIHISDLTRVVDFCISKQLIGIFNSINGNTTNEELTYLLAKKLKRRIILPNLPIFVVKLLFGELGNLLLTGIQASNEKIRNEGFVFEKDLDCF